MLSSFISETVIVLEVNATNLRLLKSDSFRVIVQKDGLNNWKLGTFQFHNFLALLCLCSIPHLVENLLNVKLCYGFQRHAASDECVQILYCHLFSVLSRKELRVEGKI